MLQNMHEKMSRWNKKNISNYSTVIMKTKIPPKSYHSAYHTHHVVLWKETHVKTKYPAHQVLQQKQEEHKTKPNINQLIPQSLPQTYHNLPLYQRVYYSHQKITMTSRTTPNISRTTPKPNNQL